MSQQYDITRHIDYENHMKNYISKAEAKQIIDNLKTQLSNSSIQSHPDYPALMRSLAEKHQKDLSRLEQEMRKKLTSSSASVSVGQTRMIPIKQHPDYPKMVSFYENKIHEAKRAAATQSSFMDQPSCPVCPACPSAPQCPPATRCPPPPKCPSAPRCPECSMEFSLAQTLRDALTEEPTAYNDYKLGRSKTTWGF